MTAIYRTPQVPQQNQRQPREGMIFQAINKTIMP
jgi:hypothetical protein